MPFYQYIATDSTGKQVRGTLQAESSDAAREALVRAGMRSVDLGGHSTPVAPVARVAPVSPQPMIVRQPTQSVPPAEVRTKKSTEKDLFFLFTQLAAAFRAGLNPAQTFVELRSRCRPIFTEAMDALAKATGEGMPMSDVMQRYPDLFPHHVVGLTRSGEQAGFLPDALEEVARHAEASHKFKRFFVWIWIVAFNALLSLPLVLIGTRAFLLAYDKIDQQGGEMDMGGSLGVVMRSFFEKLIWPWGPATLLFYAIVWGARKYLSSDRMMEARHKVGLKYPILGPRARQESFARFSWTMARLSKAGISPGRAWQLAAESVPNMAMRDVLLKGGAGWLDGRDKLSDLIHRSGVFPEEYAPMVATAEYTGDIPGAMERLAKMSQSEFDTATNIAKMRSGSWGCTLMFATGGIVLAILCWFWYHELFGKVLSGFDTP